MQLAKIQPHKYVMRFTRHGWVLLYYSNVGGRRKLASVRSMTDQQLQEGSVCTEAPEDVVHSAT